jgi:hypothetical protein
MGRMKEKYIEMHNKQELSICSCGKEMERQANGRFFCWFCLKFSEEV